VQRPPIEQMMQLRPKTMNRQPAPSRRRRNGLSEALVRKVALSVIARTALALLAVLAILGGTNLSAQTNTSQSTKPAQQQTAVAKPAQPRRGAAAHARVASIEAQPAPEAIAAPPPAPAAPIWPADQPPNQARVSWDSRGLEIEASNSSLDQILQQVAADTGVKLEGLTQDQPVQDRLIFDRRIFGAYGPGPVRDVLSQLLDGSGYNVLMIGGTDAPLEVVFSLSSRASPQAGANDGNRSNPQDEDAADPPEAETPPPPQMKTPFGNGDSGAPETQQQIMQDILDRQHKIDQQQQDQQNHPQR
jgi:hypothetical protein